MDLNAMPGVIASAAQRFGKCAAACLVAAGIVVVLVSSQGAQADDSIYFYTTTFTTTGCQPFLVPAGETEVQIDAVGAVGKPGGNNYPRGHTQENPIAGGAGGEGSEVVATVPVDPGSFISASVAGVTGGYGGFAGEFAGEPMINPGVGGDGGGGSIVSNGQFCNGFPMVIAAGGGGGGGAGTDDGSMQQSDYASGGAGATADGVGATAGGNNASHDGGPGISATSAGGGSGGAGGYGTIWGIFAAKVPLPTYYVCTPGWPGYDAAPGISQPAAWNLSVGHGATGGSGSEQDPGFGSGCQQQGLASAEDNSGGGGGGGGGYYGGGSGGGGDDYAGAGAGGGAGTSYTQYTGPFEAAPTAKPQSISITLLPVAPSVTFVQSGGSGVLSCTIDQYCDIPIRTLGYPLPQITLQDALPAGLQLIESRDQTYDIEGVPTDGDFSGDSEQVNIVGTASNGVAPNFNITQPLTVTWGPLSSLSLNPSGTQSLMAALQAAQLSVSGEYASGVQRDLSSIATWTSSDPSVATVSSTGYVNPLDAGQTTVRATWDGQSVSDEFDVTLGPATSVTVSPQAPTVGLGQTQQFTATAHYANGSTADVTDEVDWLSANESAATIDSSGLATATGTTEGAQSSIFATLSNDDGSTTSSGGGVALSVSLANPASIAVTPAAPTLAAESNTQFTAIGTYPGGATADITSFVNWSSSNDAVASFDEDAPGSLFVQPGEPALQVTVTATAPQDGVSGTAQVNTFAGDPTSVTIAAADPAVGLGATEQLTATAHYADGTTADVTSEVQWSSSDNGVVTVSSSGVATGTGTQQGAEADISAIFTGPDLRQVTGAALVMVTLDHPTAIAVTPADPTMAPGSSQTFTATGTYPNNDTVDITTLVSWTSSDTTSGSFSTSVLTALKAGGSTTVTATSPDGLATGTTQVSIKLGDPVSLTVTRANGTIGLGTSEQFTATARFADGSTADVTDSATWTSSDTTIATVSSQGAVAAVSSQDGASDSITAKFTSPDGTSVQGNAFVTNSLANPLSIAVSGSTTSMIPNQSQNLTATGTYPGGYTATLTNAATWATDRTDLVVVSTGAVTVQHTESGGTATVTATYGGVTGALALDVAGDVAISGPSSDSANYYEPYVSPTFTATGGSGSYTWSLAAGGSGLSLSATTGSSVTITGTPEDHVDSPFQLTLTATDANAGNDSGNSTFALTVGRALQSIVFATPTTGTAGTTRTLSATGGAGGAPVVFSVDAAGTPGACSVSGTNGTTLTLSAPGTCLVDANQAAGLTPNYAPAPQQQVSIDVAAGITQTIAFTAPPNGAVLPYEDAYPLVASGGGSGNPVTFTIASGYPAICSISGSSLSLNDGTGDCVIDANQAQGNGYMAAPQVEVTVRSALPQTLGWDQELDTPPGLVSIGNSYQGSPYVVQPFSNGDGTITVSVDPATTNSACTVTTHPADGIGAYDISFDHAGTCVIDADQASDTDFAPAQKIQESFTVTQGTQSIAFSSSPTAPGVGGSYVPTFNVTSSGPANSGSTNLTTANGVTACTVSGSTVQFVHVGTCTLQAFENGDSDYQVSSAVTQSFTVGQGAQSITAQSLPSTADAGSDAILSASGGGSDNLVTFSIDPATTNSACTVAGSLVYFAAEGACVIDANQAGSDDYRAAPQVTLQTTVHQYTLAITLPAFSAPASTDATTPFTIEVDEDGSPLTLSSPLMLQVVSSSSTGVFSNTAGGVPVTVVAIPAGESSVTAYYGDTTAGAVEIGALDPSGSHAFAPQLETIEPDAPTSLSFVGEPADTAVGQPISPPLQVRVTDRFGNPVTDAVVTVSDASGTLSGDLSETTDDSLEATLGIATYSGLLVADAGSDTLTATTASISATSSSFDVVGPPTVSGISPSSGDQGGGTVVTVSGSGFATTASVLFGTTPAASFNVVSDSEITAVAPAGAGQADVTVANLDGPSATSSADLFTYTAPQSLTAVATPTTQAWNEPVALSATGFSGTGSTTFHVDQGASDAGCSISGSTLSETGPGVCDVYATITADSAYSAATSSDVAVTFVPTITVTVSGTEHYGSQSPSFTYTDDAPDGVGISGSLSCSAAGGGAPSSLALGDYTIDASSCSGLAPGAPNYAIEYVAAPSGFAVVPATITVVADGSEGYGESPTLAYSDDAPAGVSLIGTLSCTTADGQAFTSLPLGIHTIDASTCSGLTPSDATDYVISYDGASDGFVVNAATITVTVSGSEAYGSSPSFTSTDDAPGGVTLSGAVSCTEAGGQPLADALPAGNYTLVASTCSGLTPSDATDYVVAYAGAVGGFVISPATITVTVSGTESFGSVAPIFSYTADPSVILDGAPWCTTAGGEDLRSLSVGTHTLDGSSCSGLAPSDANDYVVSYAGDPTGFDVTPAMVTVQISGSWNVGQSPSLYLSESDEPSGVTLDDSGLTCTTAGGQALSGLAAGTYTIDGPSCSGVTLSDPDYAVAYVGAPGGLVVSSYLGLVIGSPASSAPASTDATTPITIDLEDDGAPTTLDSELDIGLTTPSETGFFATAPGGPQVDSDGGQTWDVEIEPGQSSVTVDYGDTTAGTQQIIVYDPNNTYGSDFQLETIEPDDPGTLVFVNPSQEPLQVTAGDPFGEQVGVVDQFGNPVPGATVTMSDASGTLGGDLSETADDSGIATFSALSVAELGSDTLTASIGSVSATASIDVVGPPVVSSVSPTFGPQNGGTDVTISGDGFTDATSVAFGSTPAASYQVVSDTEITAVAPAGTGHVDVTVDNSFGTSATIAADRFSYTHAQSITAVGTPASQETNVPVVLSATGYFGTGAITYHLDQGTNTPGDTSSSGCSISGSTLSSTEPGACYVYATIAADSTYVAATSSDVAVKFVTTITVSVSGTQTYGSQSASFTYTDNAPNSVTLSGTLGCTTAGGGALASLGAGNHTLDGPSCSGLSPSDATDYVLSYVGASNGFVVSPATITVTVTGFETYGSQSPSLGYTDNAPGGVSLINTLSCTTASGQALSSLSAGDHTVDGSSCSGLSPSDANDYVLSYVGASNGFVVSPATITVTVTGFETYGSQSSTLGYTDNAPGGVSLINMLSCTTAGGQAFSSLAAGSHTVDGSSCSGLSPSDGTDYVLSYVGAHNGFTVGAATITATVSGTETYGSSPSFSSTNNAPGDVTLSGTLSCTTTGGHTLSSLAAGSHTLDGSSCSGLSPSDTADYVLAYVGATNGFVVSTATITVTVSGTEIYGSSPGFTSTSNAPGGITLSGTLGCTTAGGQSLSSLGVGSYTLDGSSCSGLAPSDATDYTVSYAASHDGFVVSLAPTAPVVSSISPASGSPSGGTGVTVTGSSFTDATSVSFGSTPAASFVVVSNSEVTAVAPAGSGQVHVTVGNNVGLSATSSADLFSYTQSTIIVTVSGNETVGGSASFSYTSNAPNGVSLSGTLSCTTAGGHALSGLSAGSYTVDGSSCSGLTPSNATDYVVSYAGAANGFVIRVGPLGVPVQSSPSAGNGVVTVYWAAGSGATPSSYRVFDSTSAGHESLSGTPVCTATGSATSCQVTGLANGTSYYFVVVASNAAGTSAASNELSATPSAPLNALVFTTEPSSSATRGGILAAQPVVTIENSSGQTVDSNATVTLSVVNTWLASVGCQPTSVAAVDGVATFSGCAIAGPLGSYQLVAASSGSTPATSSATTLTDPVSFSSATTATFMVGTAGSFTVAASSGTVAPSGSLPGWLSASASGSSLTLTGTPTDAGQTVLAFTDSGVEQDVRVTVVPSDAPSGVMATAGTGAASVSWSAPAGADVSSYNVVPNDMTTNEQGTPVSVTSGTSTTISGLTTGDEYDFLVSTVLGDNSTSDAVASNAVVPVAVAPTSTQSGTASLTTDGTSQATIGTAGASGSIVATAVGEGSVSVGTYSANPVGAAFSVPSGTSTYDVAVAPGSQFSQVSFQVCDDPAGTVYWFDPTTRAAVEVSSEAIGSLGNDCVEVTLTDSTTPSLDDLYGSLFLVEPSTSGSSSTPASASSPTLTPAAPVPAVPATSATARLAIGSAASVSVGSGANAATVTVPAGAVGSSATLSVTETTPSGGGFSLASGTTAIQVSVTSSSGQPITQFAAPLDLAFPNAPAGIVPAYSIVGVTWTEILELPAPLTLPDGWPDGWYRDASGTLHILTRHATYFGLLNLTSTVTKALQLAHGLRPTVNLNRTHVLALHLQSTLPVTVTVTLKRSNRTLEVWHIATTTTARLATLTLPKSARHIGTETLTLAAAAGGDTFATSLPLTLRATWKKT